MHIEPAHIRKNRVVTAKAVTAVAYPDVKQERNVNISAISRQYLNCHWAGFTFRDSEDEYGGESSSQKGCYE